MSQICHIFRDKDNEQMGIHMVDSDTGEVLSAESAIYLTIDDIEPDGVARIAKFQAFKWKDGLTCTWKLAYFLMTDPEDTTPPT